jgi:hypothetical protein
MANGSLLHVTSLERMLASNGDEDTGHQRRRFEVCSNRESMLSTWASTPPPIGHRSNSGEHLCGGGLRPKCKNRLQTTRRCNSWIQRCEILPWCEWNARCRRLWMRESPISLFPAMTGERERWNSLDLRHPSSVPFVEMFSMHLRTSPATRRSLGCSQLTVPWRSPETKSCGLWEEERTREHKDGRLGFLEPWRSHWPFYSSRYGLCRRWASATNSQDAETGWVRVRVHEY